MRTYWLNSSLIRSGLAASVLLASSAAFAQAVNLTAAPKQAALPDGELVPMWGYTCGAVTQGTVGITSCVPLNANAGTNWSPVLITVPYSESAGVSTTSLTINLTNNLSFGATPNNIATSIVIDGQLGGGLGAPGSFTPSPDHSNAQTVTWPAADPTTAGSPPTQGPRVKSLATEVAATAATAAQTPTPLTWNKLRPGTYLLHSGTHPSIQHPMGLYGVLVVTTAPADNTSLGTAYGLNTTAPVTYRSEVPLLLSEIDPVQNRAVAAAVATVGFSETKVWSALSLPGSTSSGCGSPFRANGTANPDYNTCYPPAVNFDPRYFLINGTSFDVSNPTLSLYGALPAATTSGSVLVRFVNAGLRMHVPSIVGAQTGAGTPPPSGMSLVAEDGNVLPGNPRVQNEVFLPAGKTYDALINGPIATSLPVFDRQLSLSTNNQRNGGMLAYITTRAVTDPNLLPTSGVTATAQHDDYFLVPGQTLTVSDSAKGVLANDIGIYGAKAVAPVPAGLALKADGTFTYTDGTPTTLPITFPYCGNGATSGPACNTVTIAACTAASLCLGNPPTANPDSYTSNIASLFKISPPGVLLNDTDPSGLPLKASPPTSIVGGTVALNADGSFTAVPACAATTSGCTTSSTVTFQYSAVNSQNTASGAATVTVTFQPPTNLMVNVKDAKNGLAINDYRWIIEEDRTVFIDPKCQINTSGPRLDSNGRPCPALPVESLGYNFHTAAMPVVAAGCLGTVSCEAGQTLLGNSAVCDVGNGQCQPGTQKTPVNPSQVYLDPAKRYFISVLPGDGVNPVVGGAGGPDDNGRPFDIATACGPYTSPPTGAWEPSGAAAMCGHAMGGAPIGVAPGSGTRPPVNILLQQTPLPTAKIAVFVFQDDNPLNGENDAGGGVDIIAPNEPGLGGFELKLFDQAGGLGDSTGQLTYDQFNMPVSNSLAGTIDPVTGLDACPIAKNGDGQIVGMIPTCPKFESDGVTESPLAGQAVIANLYPGLYEVVAAPAADRIAAGEEWLQTNTLDGTKPHEAFIKPNEPGYFQEFGPGGFHVSIGFANPKIINARKDAMCAPAGTLPCNATLNVQVTSTRMSRTPDQRLYSSGNYDAYSFTQCYVSVGPPDAADFAIEKCGPDGTVTFTKMPVGDFKLTVFDQWNDLMLDGLVSPVKIDGSTTVKEFPVTQWRSNLYTRTFLDVGCGGGAGAGDGVSQDCEPGLPLVSTNIRYRDGSFGFFNNTDLDGFAGFNEVFPFMNWLVVETDTTRYKPTGTHVVYDAGGPADTSGVAAGLANTIETVPLPANLRVPGARYCASADCAAGDTAGGSTGRVDPPWVGATQGWQGLLGQNSFIEFGMKPFDPGENGGIKGHVIYASTRPFDDPTLLLQLSWEPGVPRVQVNLYKEGTAQDGTTTLTLVDTTKTSSWDDWAQGFRSDGVPNMNCPGQDATSPFFQTLKDSKQWLDPAKTPLPNNSQFKCYDGWSMLNQIQPAPYDGMYKFPSVTGINPTTGAITGSNCTVCTTSPDGTRQLPTGKYVVEVIVPPGYELVKEEDKNILLGDVYIAPVSMQFAGLGNVFIMPDQAAVNAFYNKNNYLNPTANLGAQPRHEGDTGSIETFWPCVGAKRIVPDFNSLFPTAGQNSPFAGALRPLCDRKEVTLGDQMTALVKFYIFSSTHVAGHFTGTITNDFASEFDPFSPQFGEKFGPPNLPVSMRDFNGNEVTRVYSDQWGIYNGLYFSTYGVNPPNPTGYVPQMSIACMNDPGPIPGPNGTPITDPAYSPAYSNFCYETPFMPGFTAYMDTPVIPAQAFADGYNLPDSEYPDGTPAIKSVVSSAAAGPWVRGSGSVASVTPGANRGSFSTTPVPTVGFSGGGGSGASATALMEMNTITVTNSLLNRYSVPSAASLTATVALPSCWTGTATATCAQATVSVASSLVSLGVRRITGFNLTNTGLGYTSLPPITVACSGTPCAGTPTVTYNETLRINSFVVTNGGSGYTSAPTVSLSPGGGASTPTAAITVGPTAGSTLTITALGDKVVQNPNFSGPNAATAPYNQKTITRRYDFGPSGTVTIGGQLAPVQSWTQNAATGQDQIVVSVPSGLPNCTVPQRNQAAAACGELVITRDNGKQSIDAITVTVGGSAPWIVTESDVTPPAGTSKTKKDYAASFGRLGFSPIQTAIDSADPGDLILVQPGTYRENLIMWKPVRLQGVGAGSVTINADAHPAGKMDSWRRQVTCLFGLTIDGGTNPNNAGFDPSLTYTCPASMFMKVDRIPFEAFVGWDAAGNGNLAQILQEPTLMGAYEGAGITVAGRGINVGTSIDFWGQATAGVPGSFPDGSRYLRNTATDCSPTARTNGRPETDYGTSNFQCNPSRIDGVSIINSSQGGGAIFEHGWNHNLEIANTRIYGNHGTLSGAINLGNGETPPLYTNDGTICNAGITPAPLCPPFGAGGSLIGTLTVPPNAAIPSQLNVKNHVHHNMIINNASIGDALFSGTPSGAGGITVSAGADNYTIDHNWIAGNLSSGDGAGMSHAGVSFNGTIANNWILFNQSVNPTLPTNGGGLAVSGANTDRTLPNGLECGSVVDVDCPPGIGDGVGQGLVINANLIMGNSAESGSGGGLRLQQLNGSEVGTFPLCPNPTTSILCPGGSPGWYAVAVTNNIIANNIAGWDGGGVSLQDALKVTFVNNTVASNDTTASAGALFKTLGAINSSAPPPGCIPTPDPLNPQNTLCLIPNAPHGPQPAGLVTMANTPNLIESLPGMVVCPSGFGYAGGPMPLFPLVNADCLKLSKPAMANNMLWQNRAFRTDIVGTGSGNLSQQNIITLSPQLNQTATGQCPSGANYWDVGLRTDDIAAGTVSAGTQLTMTNSIFTRTTGVASNSSNFTPGNSPVIEQYCNGARVPPEHCSSTDQLDKATCKGFNAPPGRSETTGLSPVFVFNNITPAATVDEGHNWLNVTWGPLTLNRSAVQPSSTNPPELMVASPAVGAAGGAYSIAGTSAAVNRGTNTGAPATDFFGNLRPRSSGNPADVGAVEFQVANGSTLVVVNPAPLVFNAVVNTTTTQDLTVSNNGTTAFVFNLNTGTVTGTGLSRLTGVTGNCPTAGATTLSRTLAAGASCTIRVQWVAPGTPTGTTPVPGSVAIAGNATVTNAPVTITANAVAPAFIATVSPNPLEFGNWVINTTSAPLNLTVTNTGNSQLANLAFGFGANTANFARVTGGTFPASAPNCGTTLAAGNSCTVKVSFSPTAVTSYSRNLTVTATNATITTSPVVLTGTGVANLPEVLVAPLTITLLSGTNTDTSAIILTNAAPQDGTGATLTVNTVLITCGGIPLLGGTSGTCGSSLTGWFFNLVAGQDSCTGQSLPPGGTCTVGVRFTNVTSPPGVPHNGMISFFSNGTPSPAPPAPPAGTFDLTGFATP